VIEALTPAWRQAGSSVGVAELAFDIAVEVEMVVELMGP